MKFDKLAKFINLSQLKLEGVGEIQKVTPEAVIDILSKIVAELRKEKYKYARIPDKELLQAIEDGEVTEEDRTEIRTSKASVHSLTIKLWQKIEDEKKVSQSSKDEMMKLINYMRVLVLLPPLEAGGEMSKDKNLAQEIWKEVQGAA